MFADKLDPRLELNVFDESLIPTSVTSWWIRSGLAGNGANLQYQTLKSDSIRVEAHHLMGAQKLLRYHP